MAEVTLNIDGGEVIAPEGATILTVANSLGIDIPTLCYHPALKPYGGCRLCIVEIVERGRSRIVTSCNYPVSDGLEVKTASDRVIADRKILIELLLARCPESEDIQQLARQYGIEKSRFKTGAPEELCILCGLCVRMCDEVVGASAINFIERGINKEVAVLLSGGVDSISVAFAADYVGKDITAYSFQLDTHPSYDYQMAKKIAEIFSWKFVGITIPTINLEQDFRTLAQFCDKKTHYECVYPFLYVYPKIQEKYVLSGWAADGYYGVSKKAALHYKEPKSKFDEFRNNYFQPENQAGYEWHKKISDNYSKTLVTPYLRDNVKEYFYKLQHDAYCWWVLDFVIISPTFRYHPFLPHL